jgi:hypothetical protein
MRVSPGEPRYELQARRLIKFHYACASSIPFAVVIMFCPLAANVNAGPRCVRRRGGGKA